MYIYLPAFEKERRIASHVKNQNFAGTDFNYANMEALPYSEKYIPRLIKTTTDAYILELIPIKPKSSDYSKLYLYVQKQHYYGIKTIYFNKSGQKYKELVSKFVKRGKYWVAITAEMTNILKNHSTKMTITHIVFDQGLKDEEFSIRNLKKI